MKSIFIFIIILLCVGICAADNHINLDDIELYEDERVFVPITIENSSGITGVSTWLYYNSSIIRIMGYGIGDFTDHLCVISKYSMQGRVYISTSMDNTTLDGNLTVARIRVWAVNTSYSHAYPGDISPLDFNYTHTYIRNDTYYETINHTIRNATVMIIEYEPIIVSDPFAVHLIPTDDDNNPLWWEETQLRVYVMSESDVTSVTVNLSSLGGNVSQPMYYDSMFDRYITETNATAGTIPGIYPCRVTVIDSANEINNNTYIDVEVRMNGDIMMDDDVDIGDVLGLLSHVTSGTEINNRYVAEVTGDGNVNIFDAMLLINHLGNPDEYILR